MGGELGTTVQGSCYSGWVGLMVPDGFSWRLAQGGALDEEVNPSGLN
jgi:hypothetical protein